MLHDRETEEVCNVIIPQRQETRPPDFARRTRTDHVSKHYNDIRVCVYSAWANLYAHSQTCSNQITLRSLASFLLRTVDGSGNLLIMPINGTNHNGRARFFRKMKIKEIACHQELIIVRLFLIKQSAIVSNPSVLNQLTLVISLTSPKNRWSPRKPNHM